MSSHRPRKKSFIQDINNFFEKFGPFLLGVFIILFQSVIFGGIFGLIAYWFGAVNYMRIGILFFVAFFGFRFLITDGKGF